MRHELGHDMVAKGEVAVSKVIERLKKLVGEENVEAVAEFYAKAYAGTGLTVDEVWEEVICDSLGDMNIFSGDEAISKFIAPMLKDIKQATYDTKSKANQTRGSPEGKASREFSTKGKVAKYLSDSKVGKDNREYLYHKLINIYSGISDGYADGIAISNGKTVFIVDSGRDNGKLDFGVRRIKTIDDAQLREDFIRSTNNDTVSDGNVSDELLEKLGDEVGSDFGRDMRRESGSELSADTGESPNKQSGVSGENADQRGLTKGKASRELDSLGNELSNEQQDYFKDTKVRDENGNLLVVYHGSPRGRTTVFDRNKTSKINDMGQGHYFSSNAENASTYMGETKGRKLYEVYLNITKPFVVSDDVKISLEEAKSLLKLSEDKYAANDVYYYLAREHLRIIRSNLRLTFSIIFKFTIDKLMFV